MSQGILLSLLLTLAVVAVYLAALATWAILRDPTIDSAGRVARIIAAWILPIGAPVMTLRSIGEFCPDALPPQRWWRPFRFLLVADGWKANPLPDDYPEGGGGQRDGD